MTNSKTSSRLNRPAQDEAPPSEAPSVRAQSAVVRTLVDAIAHMAAAGDPTDGLREQLREELHRLEREEARAVNI